MILGSYPKYKKSHIDWLGDIPDSWDVLPLKGAFDLKKRPAPEDVGVITAFRDGEVTLRSNRRMDGFTEAFKEIGYQGVEPDDLVIHAMDAFAGAIGVSDSYGKSTPVYSVCKAKKGFMARYYGLALRHIALTGYIQSLAKGIRERSTDFRWSDAKNLPVPHPPMSEQIAIVEFLDREIPNIDSLISKQEKLIEYLREKKQTIIHDAITKGLDRNEDLVESGIDWIGRAPKSWDIWKLSHLFKDIGSGSTPKSDNLDYYNDGDIPWLNTGDLNDAVLHTCAKRITTKALDDYSALKLHKAPAIAIALYGATIGRISMLEFDTTANQACCVIRGSNIHQLNYLFYVLLAARNHLISLAIGGGQPNISQDIIKSLRFPLPPENQIELVVQKIKKDLSTVDLLIEKSAISIVFLKEHRSSLISSVVTGKVKVS